VKFQTKLLTKLKMILNEIDELATIVEEVSYQVTLKVTGEG
jgi:hypothetical protein